MVPVSYILAISNYDCSVYEPDRTGIYLFSILGIDKVRSVIKLAAKGFLLLIPLWLIWGYVWKKPLNYMDGEAPYYIWNRTVTNRKQEQEYDVVILGDSLANGAFLPELLSEKTINLSLGGATPAEMYYVLEEYLEHNAVPATCYLSFHDYHLQGEDTFYERTLYTHRFGFEQERDIVERAKELGESSIIKSEDYLQEWLGYYFRFPSRYLPALMSAGLNGRYKSNTEIIERNDLHRGVYISLNVRVNSNLNTENVDHFCVKEIFEEYYRKIIELCQEKGITVRIVKLPESPNIIYSKQYNSEWEKYYGDLKEEFSNIASVEWIQSYKADLFSDLHHLNMHGAVQLSRQIREMYPQDFGEKSEWSERTKEAIWDYIRLDDNPRSVLEWVDGKNLAAVILQPADYDLQNHMFDEKWKEGALYRNSNDA